jgi:hypothetical protein
MRNILIIIAILVLVCINKRGNELYSEPRIEIVLPEEEMVTYTNKEWYAFSNSPLKYYYKPIKYTEKELNLFTNILYRESRVSDTKNHIIDQYLVTICGIQTITVMKKYKSITEMVIKGSSFTMPKAK